jgi:hypothetical protein
MEFMNTKQALQKILKGILLVFIQNTIEKVEIKNKRNYRI